MVSIKALVGLSFMASVGIALLILACTAVKTYNWWPLFVLIFYVLSPIPNAIARHYAEDTPSSVLREVCYFLTTGLIVSAFALPFVLATSGSATSTVISWGQAAFTFAGNVVVFLSILFYFIFFTDDESWFSAF